MIWRIVAQLCGPAVYSGVDGCELSEASTWSAEYASRWREAVSSDSATSTVLARSNEPCSNNRCQM